FPRRSASVCARHPEVRPPARRASRSPVRCSTRCGLACRGPISCRHWADTILRGRFWRASRGTPPTLWAKGLESIRESFPPAPAPVSAPWPRPLISPAELAARFDRAELRLIECGIAYHMLPDRSDFRVKSAEPLYIAGHNPGAVFADPIAALSDRASGL